MIRSKEQAPRFFVNVPIPLAAGLDLQAGAQVQWQLLSPSDLRLHRLAAPVAKPKPQKPRVGLFGEIGCRDVTPQAHMRLARDAKCV